MRSSLAWSVLPSALAVVLLAGCRQHPDVPVKDFFAYPERWSYQLSPDGKTLSYLKPTGKERRLNIFIRPVDGTNADERCMTPETGRNVDSYFWKGNDYLIYYVDREQPDALRSYLVNRASGQVEELSKVLGGSAQLIDRLDYSPNELLVSKPGDPYIYRAQVTSNGVWSSAVAAKNPGGVNNWIIDSRGIVRGGITVKDLDVSLIWRKDEKGEDFQTVKTYDFRHCIGYGFGRSFASDPIIHVAQLEMKLGSVVFVPGGGDGEGKLYALSNVNRNTKALVAIDPTTAQEVEEICSDPKYDLQKFYYSETRRVLTYGIFAADKWRQEIWDTPTRNLFDGMAAQLKVPREQIWITGRDKSESRYLIEVASDQDPGSCYLVDTGSGSIRLTKLAERAPQLANRLAAMEPVSYQSRDGADIPAYLTCPRGYDGKRRLPLVVLVHGGPWSRNNWGLNRESIRENMEAQFLASRGYAVLQINYRGSLGLGGAHWEAGFKQWGQRMQDDLTDGVVWAIDRGTADPDRIAIMGESYGGYAALAGLAFTKHPRFHYQAAVDRAGVSNLVSLMCLFRDIAELRVKLGDLSVDADMLDAFSPALHEELIQRPLFVAHGKFDTQVDHLQSAEIVGSLYGRRAPVEYLRYDEGHVFVNEENRIDYYKKVEAFLARHLRYRCKCRHRAAGKGGEAARVSELWATAARSIVGPVAGRSAVRKDCQFHGPTLGAGPRLSLRK